MSFFFVLVVVYLDRVSAELLIEYLPSSTVDFGSLPFLVCLRTTKMLRRLSRAALVTP
jgi:hypothetical protein